MNKEGLYESILESLACVNYVITYIEVLEI